MQGLPTQQPVLDDIIPTTIHKGQRYIQAEGIAQLITQPLPQLSSTLEKLEPVSCPWLFHGLQRSTSIQQLLLDLETGSAIAVGDGSYCPHTHTTTAGWTIESENGQEYISGITVPMFSPDCHGAYRGEVSSLLAITQNVFFYKDHPLAKGFQSQTIRPCNTAKT